MGVLGLRVDDDLEERFRRTVAERLGMRKGNMSKGLEEAMELWTEVLSHKKLSDDDLVIIVKKVLQTDQKR